MSLPAAEERRDVYDSSANGPALANAGLPDSETVYGENVITSSKLLPVTARALPISFDIDERLDFGVPSPRDLSDDNSVIAFGTCRKKLLPSRRQPCGGVECLVPTFIGSVRLSRRIFPDGVAAAPQGTAIMLLCRGRHCVCLVACAYAELASFRARRRLWHSYALFGG